jgi:hypothetical protein
MQLPSADSPGGCAARSGGVRPRSVAAAQCWSLALSDALSSTRCTTTSSGSEFRTCNSSWSVAVLGISRPFLLPAVSTSSARHGAARAQMARRNSQRQPPKASSGGRATRAGRGDIHIWEAAIRPGRRRTRAHAADDPCARDRSPHDRDRLSQLRLEYAVEVHGAADRRQGVLVREHAEDADVSAILEAAARRHARRAVCCGCCSSLLLVELHDQR